MSLISMTCSRCGKSITWDSIYYKTMPTHLCETTGGQKLCNEEKQWIPKPEQPTEPR